jgi:hypothetical protein
MSLKTRIDKLAARHTAPLIRTWTPWNPPAPGTIEVITGFWRDPEEPCDGEKDALYWTAFDALEVHRESRAH